MPETPIDVVHALLHAIANSDVDQLEYSDGAISVRIRREAGPRRLRSSTPGPRAASAPSNGDVAHGDGAGSLAIRAVMSAVVHLAPAPGAPAFVKIGDRIAQGQPLCLLESMKVFSAFAAPEAGVLEAIHVRTGEDVAAGQLLFTLIKPETA